MQVMQIGAAYAATDPTAAGAWFSQHLGFQVLMDLGWYVSTKHPDHGELRVDFVQSDHGTWTEPAERVSGAMIALLVADVDSQHERIVDGGVSVLKPLVTEPWGQRRFQVAGPGGLVVEFVQPVEPDPTWMRAQGLTA
ncbi:VOC family protein [Arthrobacter sulfonylureivorans]|uniref:VOC family protein n=1 Tax=Arthrobacter sulfonylureivorans TaxID=2486855 RepID=UPI0039E3F3CD